MRWRRWRPARDAFLSRAEITRIFTLRRSLMRFLRMLGPMTEVASKLEHQDLPCLDPEVRPYFRDVLDHVRRVETRTEALRDILGSVLEVSNLLESQRQGVITRQLASWAAIWRCPRRSRASTA
jgi:magnesium transporter